jgi:hypothetical protein
MTIQSSFLFVTLARYAAGFRLRDLRHAGADTKRSRVGSWRICSWPDAFRPPESRCGAGRAGMEAGSI